jgi:hypothetical protein
MTKEGFKAFAAEYGALALWIYFGTFVVFMVVFTVLLKLGFEVKSAAGTAGVLTGAYVATKALMPVRIGLAVALTPIVAKLIRSRRRDVSV